MNSTIVLEELHLSKIRYMEKRLNKKGSVTLSHGRDVGGFLAGEEPRFVKPVNTSLEAGALAPMRLIIA